MVSCLINDVTLNAEMYPKNAFTDTDVSKVQTQIWALNRAVFCRHWSMSCARTGCGSLRYGSSGPGSRARWVAVDTAIKHTTTCATCMPAA